MRVGIERRARLVGLQVAPGQARPGHLEHRALDRAVGRDGGDVEEERGAGHVGLARTEAGVGPVDHRRSVAVDHHVERVEVAVAHHRRPVQRARRRAPRPVRARRRGRAGRARATTCRGRLKPVVDERSRRRAGSRRSAARASGAPASASWSTSRRARQGLALTASSIVVPGARSITCVGRSNPSSGPSTASARGAAYPRSAHQPCTAASRAACGARGRATAASAPRAARATRRAATSPARSTAWMYESNPPAMFRGSPATVTGPPKRSLAQSPAAPATAEASRGSTAHRSDGEALGGLGEDLGALAEREAHEVPAGGRVLVEDRARHGDHAAALRERAAELEAVVAADRADVDGGEVGALRARTPRSRRRAARRRAGRAWPAASSPELRVEVVAQPEAHRDRGLERRAVHVGEELLGGAHRGRPAPRARTPSRSSSR